MIVRRFLFLLLLASCVSAPPPDGPPVRGPTPGDEGELVVPVAVVNAMPDPAQAETFLEGMRLAAREVNKGGGIGDARLELSFGTSLGDALSGSVATLVVGPGPAVRDERADIEADRDPVLLLGGDLYSSRGLFRQVFQVSPPLAWQATALGRYLVLDRGHREVELVTEPGPIGRDAFTMFEAAWEEEGSGFAEPAVESDATVFADAAGLIRDFGAGPTGEHGQLAATGDALGLDPPGALSVVSYPYTWAGWADPIPRVHRFRQAFERFAGRQPRGFEQEGYDAIRVLAAALDATDGEGGDPLVRALESVDDATYSSLPIALGPDDHLFAGRGQIGIFARLAPDEIDDETSPTGVPWAPLMRTFTYNGRRTSIVDRDKDVFFPGWERREPAPNYHRSVYGIVSGPEDPRH